jgi:hypothetical protein
MARFGCLALAVVVAMALLIFIVFLWSGWLNRPVGHALAAASIAHDTLGAAPAEGASHAYPLVFYIAKQDGPDLIDCWQRPALWTV